MDAELKAKWVKALRSGEYQQAVGRLRVGSKFCCLGVLCEVAGLKIEEDGYGVGEAGYLPIGRLIDPTFRLSEIYDRNDSGVSFPEIADYIERNL